MPDKDKNPNIISIGPDAIMDSKKGVIAYKGETFYKTCDVVVTGDAQHGTSHCVKPAGHGGTTHVDFDGAERDLSVLEFDFSSLTLGEAVFQAIGAASMCWEHMENTGVFDDKRAKNIGDALMKRIREAGPIYG